MLREVFQGSLAGDNSLDKEAKVGNQGEAAVLDLLHLELSKRIGIVSKAQRIEGSTGIEAIKALSPGTGTFTAPGAEGLGLPEEDNLDSDSSHDGLSMNKGGVAEVVQAIIREDGGTGLEPDGGITEISNAVSLEELGGDDAEGTEESPASVDDLNFTETSKGLGVSGQAGSVPAVVSGVFALQVAGDIALREGAQELGTVCKKIQQNYKNCGSDVCEI